VDHRFEVYKERRWQSSDFLLRVYEDPMFVEITEQEALSLIEAQQPS